MSGPSSSPAGSGSDDLEALLAEELANSPSASSPPPSEGNDAGDGDDPRQSTPPAPRPLKKIKTAQESYCPPHPGYMGGLCIRCGMEKTQAELEERRQRPGGDLSPRSEYFLKLKGRDDGDGLPPGSESPKNMALNYIHHGLEVSKTEMERAKMATKRQALERKKLLLVLDLDHTLLNSTRMTDLSEEDTAKLHEMMQVQEEKYQAEGVPPVLYHLGHMNMWTKFRPGVREFLARSQKNFDLHVFTMGDKKYATEMVRLLDPSGSLFHGRVASRGDAAEGTLTKDLDVLLGSDDMMIILDDTEGVWPKHLSNLITMPRWVFELMNRSESTSRRGPTTLTRACVHSFIRPSVRPYNDRYIYFRADAVKFGVEGTSYMEVGGDEDPDEDPGSLGCTLRVLERAHELFFRLDERFQDIRQCLLAMRICVLEGCTIMFTRVISKDADQRQHPAWMLATILGAKCVEECSSEVTHVVTGGTTSKSEWGKKHGKHVVSMNWLYACFFKWERADEKAYPYEGKSRVSGGLAGLAGVGGVGGANDDDVKAALAAAGGGRG